MNPSEILLVSDLESVAHEHKVNFPWKLHFPSRTRDSQLRQACSPSVYNSFSHFVQLSHATFQLSHEYRSLKLPQHINQHLQSSKLGTSQNIHISSVQHIQPLHLDPLCQLLLRDLPGLTLPAPHRNPFRLCLPPTILHLTGSSEAQGTCGTAADFYRAASLSFQLHERSQHHPASPLMHTRHFPQCPFARFTRPITK